MPLPRITPILLILLGVLVLSGCGEGDAAPVEEEQEVLVADYGALIRNLTIDDYQSRMAASNTLTGIGEEAVPQLVEFLRNQSFDDPDDSSFRARWESVNVLGRIKDGRAAEALLERILHDGENHVRWRSIWALSAIEHEGEQESLRFHLNNEDEKVRWNAAVALATYHDARSIEVLKDGLQDNEDWKRWEATYCLGLVGNSEAASYALGVLNDDAKRVRQEAIMTISKSGDESFRETLFPLINDSEPGIRWRAAEAVVNLGHENATGLLDDMLRRELDGNAKKELDRIRERLG